MTDPASGGYPVAYLLTVTFNGRYGECSMVVSLPLEACHRRYAVNRAEGIAEPEPQDRDARG